MARVFGGSDSMRNRVLLHSSFHSRVHNRELKVVKTASHQKRGVVRLELDEARLSPPVFRGSAGPIPAGYPTAKVLCKLDSDVS